MEKRVRENRLAELRIEESEGKMILEGYAIVFEQETLIGTSERGFIEVISKDALKNTIMKDVPLKYNHADSFLILARTKNNSLVLTIDEIGLKVHAELIDTSSNRDVYKMVRSGLLDKMSFAFVVNEQTWNKDNEVPIRRIESIERLFDVSIVDIPAYEGTSIYSRSLDLVETELKAMEVVNNMNKASLLKKKINIKTRF